MLKHLKIILLLVVCIWSNLNGELTKQEGYTIVTAFFDIDRGNWNAYRRDVDTYFNNAKRVFSLDDYMVIYIEPKHVDFVMEQRKLYPDKTKIIPMEITELPYYKYKDQIQAIMEDPKFRAGLASPSVPEVTKPLYNVLMWSKVPLVVKTIEENPFNTSHFVWLDFGIHQHILQYCMLYKPLLSEVDDRIKILCRVYPMAKDLDIERFYKSHHNRFAGGMITGNAANFALLNQYMDDEVQDCLAKKIVDCDQSLYAIAFLKHPELFELYYGDWAQIISNYYKITQNLPFVKRMAFNCRKNGMEEAAREIEKRIAETEK